jgi:hypothetical protein
MVMPVTRDRTRFCPCISSWQHQTDFQLRAYSVKMKCFTHLMQSGVLKIRAIVQPTGKLSQRQLVYSLLIWACFTLFALNAFAFIFYATAAHIRSDVLRHLEEIVLPLLEGRAGLSILWSNHHPAPLLHLIQIANLKFFGFRLDYDAFLGFFFQVLGIFLILKSILTYISKRHNQIGFMDALGALLIISIALGFNSLLQYTWPLLATVQYLYFFAIVVFLLVDRCIAAESRSGQLAIAAASLIFMFANADYGTIFLAAIIAVLMLVYSIERKAVYLRTTLILAAAWIAYRLILLAILPESAPAPPDYTSQLIANLLSQPIITFTRFALALGTGLVDTASIKNDFPGREQLLIGIAQLNAVVFVAIFITYLRKKLYRASVAPLALMLASVIFSVSILIYRYWEVGDNIWALANPRYVPNFKLANIGMLWAMWLILKDHAADRAIPMEWPYRAVAALGIGLILFIQLMQIHAGWTNMPKLREHNDNQALVVYLAGKTMENHIPLPKSITEALIERQFPTTMAYLEKNRLNVFADNFPAGVLLDQHVKSRQLFNNSDNAMTIVFEKGEDGDIPKINGNIDVDWKLLPTGILISNTTAKTLYLRINASSNVTVANGISLITQSKNGKSQNVVIHKGHQNRFFRLENGERLKIETSPAVSIEEIELRI